MKKVCKILEKMEKVSCAEIRSSMGINVFLSKPNWHIVETFFLYMQRQVWILGLVFRLICSRMALFQFEVPHDWSYLKDRKFLGDLTR